MSSGAGAAADAGALIVDDDGPGLTPAQRDQVARRGSRLDQSKPGSGLGLSIVTELAALYGGTLQLGTAPIGGLRAELRFAGHFERVKPESAQRVLAQGSLSRSERMGTGSSRWGGVRCAKRRLDMGTAMSGAFRGIRRSAAGRLIVSDVGDGADRQRPLLPRSGALGASDAIEARDMSGDLAGIRKTNAGGRVGNWSRL